MTHPYECEVRFAIPDISAFQSLLNELGAKIINRYVISDRYYHYSTHQKITTALRIREWVTPKVISQIMYSRYRFTTVEGLTFKESLLKKGKTTFHEGPLKECQEIMKSLGMTCLTNISREGVYLTIPDQNTTFAYEHFDTLGWIGEIEADGINPQETKKEMSRIARLLNIDLAKATAKPMYEIFRDGPI